jgi:hypothetical protein
VFGKDLRRSLWGSGGEEDENFLDEGNCGDLLVLALTDTDTVGSIGSSRRGYLLYSVPELWNRLLDDHVAGVIWACEHIVRAMIRFCADGRGEDNDSSLEAKPNVLIKKRRQYSLRRLGEKP